MDLRTRSPRRGSHRPALGRFARVLGAVALVLLACAGTLHASPPAPGSPTSVVAIAGAARAVDTLLPQTHEIDVFHLNDIHGFIFQTPQDDGTRTGGMALLADALAQEREDAARRGARWLFLFAGDMFQGTPVVDDTQGECMVRLFNDLRLDAACLGNHEFDYGPGPLEHQLALAHFAMLDCNVDATPPIIRALLHKDLLVNLGGVTVGLVGATTSQTRTTSFPRNVADFTFADPIDAIDAQVRRMRAAGAQVIIAITHDGVEVDKDLARRVPGIDLIVGGHSHTTLRQAIIVDQTPIVQAGDNGRFLGEVRLAWRPDHERATLLSDRLIPLVDPPLRPDPVVEAKVQRYLAPVRGQWEKIVGDLKVPLPRGLRGDFSPVGGLAADAIREALGTQIALVNQGGLRRGLPPGPVSAALVHELAPFGNLMVTMELTGAQIRQLLERSASGEWLPYTSADLADVAERTGRGGARLLRGLRPGHRVAGFLQGSGLSFTMDPARPEGTRIVEVLVGGQPLEDGRYYTIACSNYLAAGGDGMVEFTHGRGATVHPLADHDVIAAYLTRHRPLVTPPINTVRNVANVFESGSTPIAESWPQSH